VWLPTQPFNVIVTWKHPRAATFGGGPQQGLVAAGPNAIETVPTSGVIVRVALTLL